MYFAKFVNAFVKPINVCYIFVRSPSGMFTLSWSFLRPQVGSGFSSDFVNFHSFSNFEFWLRFSFISRFRSLFLRAGPLLMV